MRQLCQVWQVNRRKRRTETGLSLGDFRVGNETGFLVSGDSRGQEEASPVTEGCHARRLGPLVVLDQPKE